MMTTWKHKTYKRQGLSHKSNHNAPCQDYVKVVETDHVIIAVLADGLGSLELSQVASENVALAITKKFSETNCNAILKLELSQIKEIILSICKSAVTEIADKQRQPVSQMDCTLLFAYIAKKQNKAIIGQIGDGAICIMHEKSGELFSVAEKTQANATSTVFSANAMTDFKLEIIDTIEHSVVGFIITSDGLENELYLQNSVSIKHKASLYLNAVSVNYNHADAVIEKRLGEITASVDYGFDDDISLAILSNINYNIDLPKDASWLCLCDARNELHCTRCHACNRDFVALYRGIKFGERGGKSKFFEWLNENPEEERKILGTGGTSIASKPQQSHTDKVPNADMVKKSEPPVNDPTVVYASIPDEQIKKVIDAYNSTQTKKHKVGFYILACFVCFIIGCSTYFLIPFIQSFFGVDNNNVSYENAVGEKLYIMPLSDDEIFVGNLIDGMPNGYGAVFLAEGLQIGFFNNGQRRGVFVEIDTEGNKSELYFEDALLIETDGEDNNDTDAPASMPEATTAPTPETPETTPEPTIPPTPELTIQLKEYIVNVTSARIRERPNQDATITLTEGNIVFSDGTMENDNQGRTWLLVKTENGHEGWVLMEQLQEKKPNG